MYKLFAVYVFLRSLAFPCHNDKTSNDMTRMRHDFKKIKRIGKLQNSIYESSGLTTIPGSSMLITLNDGGNPPELYFINQNGRITNQLTINDHKNKDWESVTIDTQGNIYIGDFGNNANKRKDLTIIKYDTLNKSSSKIQFSYPDQSAFPPSPNELNFDCEAMFWANDSLYLVSKNRGKGPVRLYSLPSVEGSYRASLVDSINITGMITGADYSIDKKEIALLGYGHVYIFKTTDTIDFKHPKSVGYYGRLAQSEAIAYDKNDLLISNEGGKIFRLTGKK